MPLVNVPAKEREVYTSTNFLGIMGRDSFRIFPDVEQFIYVEIQTKLK